MKIISTILTKCHNIMKLQSMNILYDIVLFIINLIISYFMRSFSLFVSLASIDSIYTAIDFIKHNSNDELTESQVLTTSNELYKVGTMERYVYYGICQVVYSYLSIFVFNTHIPILRYCICLGLTPFIFNNAVYGKMNKYFDILTKEKNAFIKKICFEQIANTVIRLEKIYLECNSALNKQEIMNALNHIDDIKSEIGTLFKNTLITLLMIYLRNNSKLYYKMAKYIYVYGYNEHIKDISVDKAKQLFRDVIINKKYSEMTKPMFIQSIIYLYCAKEDTGSFKKLLNKFKYRFVITLTIWPIASFFTGYIPMISILIMSVIVMMSRKLPLSESYLINTKYLDDRSVLSLIITSVIGLATVPTNINILLMSFCSQFSGMLLVNNFTLSSVKIINKNLSGKIKMITNDIHFSKIITCQYLGIAVSFIVFTKMSSHSAYLMPIITNFIDSKKFKYIYLFLYIGMMNNRNMDFGDIKILFLAYMMSIIDNVLTAPEWRKKYPMKVCSNTTTFGDKEIVGGLYEDYFSHISDVSNVSVISAAVRNRI